MSIEAINKRITLRYIYILFVPQLRYLYRAKIGISNDVPRRVKEIRDSIYNETRREANVRIVFKVPFLAAESWEGRLHRLTIRFAATMPGNGRTEWRYFINVFTALLCGYFGRELDFKNGEVMRFLVVAFIPVPLDFILLVAVTFLLELSIFIISIYIIYNIYEYTF
jgi:hypothetical protein